MTTNSTGPLHLLFDEVSEDHSWDDLTYPMQDDVMRSLAAAYRRGRADAATTDQQSPEVIHYLSELHKWFMTMPATEEFAVVGPTSFVIEDVGKVTLYTDSIEVKYDA